MRLCTLHSGFTATKRSTEFATRGARSFTRLLIVVSFVACVVALSPTARAVEIQIEGLQDTLAQPPAPVSNHCTLRKAIINANNDAATYPQCQAGSGADTIVFNLPGKITFALAGANEDNGLTGDLDIKKSLMIVGHPDGTTIDAADLDRVFHINPAGAPGVIVTLVNIHITNGKGNGGGGGISVTNATLRLDGVTISSCEGPNGDGGAISFSGGTLKLNNCTISGNKANHHAGAILIESGTAHITHTTITGNTTSPGFTNLTGGIRNTGTVNLRNSIIAGNNPGGQLPNLDGTFKSQGYNVIGELGNQPGNPTITPGIADQKDVNVALVKLGPLQNNGGPTPTHALLAGSIAIDKGHASAVLIDQRKKKRPCDNKSIPNALRGDGSDVGAYEASCLVIIPPPQKPSAAARLNE